MMSHILSDIYNNIDGLNKINRHIIFIFIYRNTYLDKDPCAKTSVDID